MVRPLVGMDKNEIVDQARALGTFETSIQPDQDCCSPCSFRRISRLHANLDEVRAAEGVLEVETMVADAVRKAEIVRLKFP